MPPTTRRRRERGIKHGDSGGRGLQPRHPDRRRRSESVRRHRRRQDQSLDLRPLPREHARLLPRGAGDLRQRDRDATRARSARTSARRTSWVCRAPRSKSLQQIAFDQLGGRRAAHRRWCCRSRSIRNAASRVDSDSLTSIGRCIRRAPRRVATGPGRRRSAVTSPIGHAGTRAPCHRGLSTAGGTARSTRRCRRRTGRST